MIASLIRVLIAEDHARFRLFLRSALQGRQDLQLVCEVDDGLEAVRKAQELQPELILLDIGLPSLNGIDAARQIRSLSPLSKILFVSQESSPELVQAVLQTGARGYVLKIDVGADLIPAIDAVLQGNQYVSRSITRHESVHVLQPTPKTVELKPATSQTAARRHEVGFYSDEQLLMDGYTAFVGATLRNDNVAIFVASESVCDKLLLRLQAYGIDMSAAIERGRYIALDNAKTLADYMVKGMPDPVLFFKATDQLLTKAAAPVNGDRSRISACGECAPALWEKGNIEAAVRTEQLWDGLAKSYGIQIFCGYSLASFHRKDGDRAFERICAEHSAVLPR